VVDRHDLALRPALDVDERPDRVLDAPRDQLV
jgi:hypothetical protein